MTIAGLSALSSAGHHHHHGGAREIREVERAVDWLARGLCLSRVQKPGGDLGDAMRWLHATVEEAGALPPPAVVIDLGQLATGVTPSFGLPVPASDRRLGDAVRLYEDQFLGRLTAERLFEAATEAIKRLPAERAPAAVGFLIARVLERAGFRKGVAIAPGVLRRMPWSSRGADLLAQGLDALAQRPADDLAEDYEALVRAAREASALVASVDVFELEHFELLAGSAERLSLRQVLDATARLERALPARVRGSKRAANAQIDTRIEDDSTYPAGGLSALANSGAMENLVRSELVYMERGAEIDPFAVRYVQGELLYYTRDDSVFLRRRRAVHLVLCADLASARFKDPDMPWQRTVAMLALVRAIVSRLTKWLNEEALTFRVLLVDDAQGQQPLASEAALLRLALEDSIQRGECEIRAVKSLAEAAQLAADEAKRAWCTPVVFASGPGVALPLEGEAKLRHASVSLEGARPAVTWRQGKLATSAPADESDVPWHAWETTAVRLLRELV